MPLPQAHRQRSLVSHHERRRFQRVKVNLLGRFMLEDRREYPCQTVDISPGSAAIIAAVVGKVGERVVVYVDHVGRIEGAIVRIIEGGFAMSINASPRKRDKLAAKLTWLANRHELDLPEDRRHERLVPENPIATVTLPDDRELRCRIIDLSLSGAALASAFKPPIESPLKIGSLRAIVVRHFEDGFAVEFAVLQTEGSIAEHFR
jgi:c-di-GMP-binding flagellar brake protein YcgR